jgi:hypothetical protein
MYYGYTQYWYKNGFNAFHYPDLYGVPSFFFARLVQVYFDPDHSASPAANRPADYPCCTSQITPPPPSPPCLCLLCLLCLPYQPLPPSVCKQIHSIDVRNGDCRPSATLSGHDPPPPSKLRRSLKGREPEAPRAKRKSPSSPPQIQKVIECVTCGC